MSTEDNNIGLQDQLENGFHTDLFWANSVIANHNGEIIYYQVNLYTPIPGFAINKEFALVVLDLAKGTLSFYRDYVRYDDKDPNVVLNARLHIQPQPTQ